jgi:hypothetical protein
MAELALDDQERDPVAGHLDRVRMSQLVGRESASDSGGQRRRMQLAPMPAGEHDRPRVGPRRTQNSAPADRVRRSSTIEEQRRAEEPAAPAGRLRKLARASQRPDRKRARQPKQIRRLR